MIYEHRVYRVVSGKREAVKTRFRDVTMGLFEKHGMKVVGFWQDLVGENNELMYILAFEDLNHMNDAWASFRKDPDWIKAQSESEADGPIVAGVTNKVMVPTDFSPLQ